jgi:hypothetical protein
VTIAWKKVTWVKLLWNEISLERDSKWDDIKNGSSKRETK